MGNHVKTLARTPVRATAGYLAIGTIHVNIGGTGAPTIDKIRGLTGLTFTRSSAGVYAVAGLPICQSLTLSVTLRHAAGVDLYPVVTAQDATAGTATITCLTGTTTTEVPSGGAFDILVVAELDN